MKVAKKALSFFVSMSAVAAFAHFQMVYTPKSVVDEGEKSVDFKVVFTHPAESGHTMDIGKDEAGNVKGMKNFFVVHKGEKTDCVKDLKPITFSTNESSGKAFDFQLNGANGLKGAGDWVIVAVPHPYYEGSEDIYIQQITKVMINRGEQVSDWDERAAEGYPEIMPLVKPYDVWVGGVFRGVVVDPSGKAVANCEIEVEYVNYPLNMKANTLKGKAKAKKCATVIKADSNGNFSFVPTSDGYWGFAALGAGGEKTHGGKELSQDAVLWIEAQKTK